MTHIYDYKRLLEALSLLDRAASMAPLNRVDHVNIQKASTELNDYFQARSAPPVAVPAGTDPSQPTCGPT